MSGTLTVFGEMTIGAVVPYFGAAVAAMVGDLQTRLAGAVKLKAALTVTPPTLLAKIALCEQLLVVLRASLSLGLPGVNFQITAVGTLIAQLEAELTALIGIGNFFATGGVLAAAYSGDTKSMGPTITAQLGGGILGGQSIDQCYAVILAARAGASIQALQGVFIHA